MVVIVTERLYIVSQKIHSMFVEEQIEEMRYKGRVVNVPVTTIKVQFEPINANPNQRNDNQFGVDVKVYSRKKAISLFKEMVKQIREQCPDQLYLDKIAENFLMGEVPDDTSADEICNSGEAERRSKKVLRKSRKRPKRRKSRNRR